MKKTTVFIVMILISGIIYGQENSNVKNSARFGINGAFFGSGDIIGPSIYGEYSISLNDYFAIVPKVMCAYANRNSETTFSHASSFGTSLAVRITPLPNSFRRFKVDIGGLYHKFIKSSGNVNEITQYGSYRSIYSSYRNDNLFGLMGSLSFNIVDNKKTVIGIRFDMLTSIADGYLNCDSWQIGTYIGIKL